MTAPTQTRPTLTDEQLREVFDLISDSDSVELKVTVPEPQQRSTAIALGMDPLEAQIRQVYFFETPDLQLNDHGVVVRARRIQGKGADSVVKLRPVVPAELPADVRTLAGFRVEVDALPGGYVCSGTLKGETRSNDVRRAGLGEIPVRKLFSKEQRAYYAAHAPEGVALDDLIPLGPIFVLKMRFTPPELDRSVVAEMWIYPDGSRILELSTRCAPNLAFQVAAQMRVYLMSRGIDVGAEQATKTHKALEYFAHELRKEEA